MERKVTWSGNFADNIQIVVMLIKRDQKDSKKSKRIRNNAPKSKFCHHFLLLINREIERLIVSGKSLLKYKSSKFHLCGVHVTRSRIRAHLSDSC